MSVDEINDAVVKLKICVLVTLNLPIVCNGRLQIKPLRHNIIKTSTVTDPIIHTHLIPMIPDLRFGFQATAVSCKDVLR